MKRTPRQWADYCVKNFQGGYTPGGKARDLYASGQVLARFLHEWGAWEKGDYVLDVGCGNGRLAMGLIGQGVVYCGLDILPWCIRFCEDAFKGYPEFHFMLLNARNGHYLPQAAQDPAQVVYPMSDRVATAVIANSLFSHTETLRVAERNLREMHRVLKPGGKLFATWRLVPPHADEDDNAQHTNYLRGDVLRLLEATGFTITSEVPGLPREISTKAADSQTGFLVHT